MFSIVTAILNIIVIGGLCWVAFRQNEGLEKAVREIISLEMYLAEIEAEEHRLRRVCGDFAPSTGENKMANKILSVIRRWRTGEK
jgi:hypothetical protein